MLKLNIALILLSLLGCSSRLSNPPIDLTDSPPTTAPVGTLLLSPRNTKITFIGSAIAASHEGTFTRFHGQIVCGDSVPEHAAITVQIDMTSVYTQIDLLTKHLKDPDFFDVVKYPKASFVSTGISPIQADNTRIITGNLTLHGITRSISFPAHLQIDGAKLSMDAKPIIRQSDFQMASSRTTTDDVPVNVSVHIEE